MKKKTTGEKPAAQPMPPIASHFARMMNQMKRDELLEQGLCPNCGQDTLVPNSSSCRMCSNCGWSSCDL